MSAIDSQFDKWLDKMDKLHNYGYDLRGVYEDEAESAYQREQEKMTQITEAFYFPSELPEGARIAKGMAIIAKYQLEAEFMADYDQIWFGDYQYTYDQMDDKERSLMNEYGWWYSTGNEKKWTFWLGQES